MSKLEEQFKHAMRNMIASVSILTHRKGQDILGMTVTSAASYSAEPPIFMAAIHRESTLASRLSLGDKLTMNLLTSQHEDLARRFSGRTGVFGADRFLEGAWDMSSSPRLIDALASFSGHLRALIPQASHAILLVEIETIKENQGEPLAYHHSNYLVIGENNNVQVQK